MSEWLPQVCKIQKIEKHPNADTLSIATVMGEYPVVIKNNQYKVGDLVSYISYDSIVPDTEQFHFLSPSLLIGEVPIRSRIVRVKKIRGVYSEGLIVPAPPGFNEGDSITEYFGLTKRVYEEELPEHGTNRNEVSPKTFSLSKYDLEGMAKYGYAFDEGEEVIITEKIEGENYTAIYTEDRFWVRSRNWFKKDDPDSHWWQVARQYKLEEKLKTYPGLAFWGECYGGVKHFKFDCPVIDGQIKRRFRVFDIWDISHNRFLEWKEVVDICNNIELDVVPVLYKGPFHNNQALRDLAEGQSTIGTCVREGIVIKSVPEAWHPKLGRKIIKLKGRGYKLFKG